MNPRSTLTGKHLYLDCYSGIAGDMFLGAMLDLGVPEQIIREGLAALPLTGYELQISRTKHMSIVGCDVKVIVHEPDRAAALAAPEPPAHGHRDHDEHGHHHPDHVSPPGPKHVHRSWSSIRTLIEQSTLAAAVKRRALEIFQLVAQAEAKLHGTDPEAVTFHEVGAIDSIVDIVGAALALDYLQPRHVSARPVPLGHGTIFCAHGLLPVPSPAALEILKGAMVEDGGVAQELCTPTGAAIVKSCVEAFGTIPRAKIVATGYGAGDCTLPDRPNHLRAILFEPETISVEEESAIVVEANMDDMSPQWCGHLLDRLFAVGARDVWYTPIIMKKGRPALTISALCSPGNEPAIIEVLLTESTTIGLRFHTVGRKTLLRRFKQVQTAYGPLTIKEAFDGERIVNAAPEYDTCRDAAVRHNVALKEVWGAAIAAYHQRPLENDT